MILCENCKKNPATFHLTNLSPGAKSEHHLCDKCAMEQGMLQAPKPSAAEAIDNLLKKGKLPAADVVCDNCGISFYEFRNQGVLGCPKDYDVFAEALRPLLDRAHGSKQHVGKAPRSMANTARRTRQQEIQKLKRQLKEAVGAEDYERAAELRDRIHTLESA